MNQDTPKAPKGAHLHQCRTPHCQTFVTCYSPIDQCPLGDSFVCAACELDAYDRYMDTQELNPNHAH